MTTSTTFIKKTFLYITAALIIVYCYQYYRYPTSTGIIQTQVNEFQWEMLFSKQPVFISSRVPVDQLTTIFNAWFGKSLKPIQAKQKDWPRNVYKYLIVYNPSDSTQELILAPPHTVPNPEDGSILALQIKPNQLVIVPFHWYYQTEAETPFWIYGYHDWVTWFLP